MPDASCAANVLSCRKEAEMNTQKLTILYERLSVDDERDKESMSIANQRVFLEEYDERNGFRPYIHIQDDGYTDTNWNRPGWQKIIEEVEKDNVSTLVFKDLSRFGRDHLRVGLYMEMVHEKGIRLIMVNDGIDTAKSKQGKPLSTKLSYGFMKDPKDKNKWLMDSDAAAIVRRIFNLTVDGKGSFEILHTNPCKKVKRMGNSDSRSLEFWTIEEYQKFIQTVEQGTRYYLIFEILFLTGCRIGELLALIKGDIYFERNQISITKTYYRTNRQDVITDPKTKQSVRMIEIPEFLKQEIKDFVDGHYGMSDDERLFPIVQEAVQHKMKRQIMSAGVKKIRVHDIRHYVE